MCLNLQHFGKKDEYRSLIISVIIDCEIDTKFLDILRWKTVILVSAEVLGRRLNTLPSDENYSRHKRERERISRKYFRWKYLRNSPHFVMFVFGF